MRDGNGSLVLIVDDTPHNVEVLGSVLRAAGYRLAVAQDGTQALAFVEQKVPDLILLDIMMPGMDGIEVCRRLKSQDATKSIPVIFITALTEIKDKVQGFEAGGVDYVTKPFSGPEVLARVQTHLTNARLTAELRQANAKLRELNQLKNRFLGMAAHDLRSPLAAISGFTSLLLDEKLLGPLTAQQRDFVARVFKNGVQMLNLVDDLLDVSAIESGKLELRLKPGSLQALIEERVQLLEPVAEGKQIRIRTAFAEVDDVVHDADRIGQIVDNLISNAVKFSPPETTVSIRLVQEGQLARFDVKDEGPGIPPQEQSRLFGEFERLSPRPTAGEKSTGLGLSISKRIAETHGGELRAESEVGSGSTFSLLLPLAGPPPEAGSGEDDEQRA